MGKVDLNTLTTGFSVLNKNQMTLQYNYSKICPEKSVYRLSKDKQLDISHMEKQMLMAHLIINLEHLIVFLFTRHL